MVNKLACPPPSLTNVLPSVCALCQLESKASGFCPSCRLDLPVLTTVCQCCGVDLVSDKYCAKCINKAPNYDRVIAAYSYERPVDKLIREMKYKQRLEVISFLGEDLVAKVKQKHQALPECLIPVPLHSFRLVSRGFNQALELARFLNRELSIPVDHHLVKRSRRTAPQFELPHKARQANVRKAFQLRETPVYQSVAIVDDIVTSGATVSELARLLKLAGVKDVSVWALARANQ